MATYTQLDGAPSTKENWQQPPAELKSKLVQLFFKPNTDKNDTDDEASSAEDAPVSKSRANTASKQVLFPLLNEGGIGESPMHQRARHNYASSNGTQATKHARLASATSNGTSVYSERGRDSITKLITSTRSPITFSTAKFPSDGATDSPAPSSVAQLGSLHLSAAAGQSAPLLTLPANPATVNDSPRRARSQEDLLENVPASKGLGITSKSSATSPSMQYTVDSAKARPIIAIKPKMHGKIESNQDDERTRLVNARHNSLQSDNTSVRHILREIRDNQAERTGWQQSDSRKAKTANTATQQYFASRVPAAVRAQQGPRMSSQPIGVVQLIPQSSPQIDQTCDFFRTGRRKHRKRWRSSSLTTWLTGRPTARTQSRDWGVQTQDRDVTPTGRPRTRSIGTSPLQLAPPQLPRRRASSFGGMAGEASNLALDLQDDEPESGNRESQTDTTLRQRQRRISAQRYRYLPNPIDVPSSKRKLGQAADLTQSPSAPIFRLSCDSQLLAEMVGLEPAVHLLTPAHSISRKPSDTSTATALSENFQNLFFELPADEPRDDTPTTLQRNSLVFYRSSFPTVETNMTSVRASPLECADSDRVQSHRVSIVSGPVDIDNTATLHNRRASEALSHKSYIDIDHSPQRERDADNGSESKSFLEFSPPASPVLDTPIMLSFPVQDVQSDSRSLTPGQWPATPDVNQRSSSLSNVTAAHSEASRNSSHSFMQRLDSFPLPDVPDAESSPSLRSSGHRAHNRQQSVAQDWISVYTAAYRHPSIRYSYSNERRNESLSWLDLSPERSVSGQRTADASPNAGLQGQRIPSRASSFSPEGEQSTTPSIVDAL